ncbi:MAG: metallophosphoesterase family protein [Ardenticatenia bacterium]|nr:metallophosphoesterase family protein [Ardenticatenia bacterium]
MRYLIISDIHANAVALETVLEAAAVQGFDEVWCLGDIVGYGPDPNECVEKVRDVATVVLAGNHDWAALGKLDVNDFNPEARQAVEWTQEQLTDESRAYLLQLPPRVDAVAELFTLAHGSPRHPIWEYILYPSTASENFEHFETPFCLVGHTHQAVLFRRDPVDGAVQALMPALEYPLPLHRAAEQGVRLIINPGSVGQPRDGDPRASFAIYDAAQGVFTYYRVSYHIEETQERMRAVGLPERLITRLEYGW